MTLVYILVALILFFALATFHSRIKLYRARKNGKYPLRGQVQKDDVLQLVSDGQTAFAMRAYRELHHCGLREAKKAIQQIKKEQQDQN